MTAPAQARPSVTGSVPAMTRVLIVDDHPVFRDGLAGLLATVPEVEVVGTAGTAEEALARPSPRPRPTSC